MMMSRVLNEFGNKQILPHPTDNKFCTDEFIGTAGRIVTDYALDGFEGLVPGHRSKLKNLPCN